MFLINVTKVYDCKLSLKAKKCFKSFTYKLIDTATVNITTRLCEREFSIWLRCSHIANYSWKQETPVYPDATEN